MRSNWLKEHFQDPFELERQMLYRESARHSQEQDDESAIKEALGQAGKFVGKHPLIVLGVAATVGFSIGWWVKRS